MLQNARVAAYILSELLRGNEEGGKITPKIRVKYFDFSKY